MYAEALTTERMIPTLTNSLMYAEALTTERMIPSLYIRLLVSVGIILSVVSVLA
jgi:hypothetical protein